MRPHLIALFVVAVAPGCAATGEQTASFTYDLDGRRTLYAYPLEPAAETRQAERVANRLYGVINTRSPDVVYFCTWRDTSSAGTSGRNQEAPPSKLFLGCSFGTSPWSPPPGLIDAYKEHSAREEAVVRVEWERRDARYVISRFEVEIRNPSLRQFRSSNFGATELSAVKIQQHEMRFPDSSKATFSFDLSATVPFRRNTGEKASGPTVSLKIEGIAAPTPKWLLY